MALISLADSLRDAPINSQEFDLVIKACHRMIHDNNPDADKCAVAACRQALVARFGNDVAALKDLMKRIGKCDALCLLTDTAVDGPDVPVPAIDAFVAKHIAGCDHCALVFSIEQVRRAFSRIAGKPDRPSSNN